MKVVLIGAGNVATHLSKALKKAKHNIIQVYSRSASSAKELARTLKSSHITDIRELDSKADIYIISISDPAIPKLLKTFPFRNKLVVHTSGSVSLKVFAREFKNHGVIYPLQTFSKERDIVFREVPLLIEASNEKSLATLRSLSLSISPFVFGLDSADRKTVHLSAVVANNFTNHLFVIAEKILRKKNIPFTLLGPLLYETVIKAMKLGPAGAQTGPAKRGDTKIIGEHLSMLKNERYVQQIYRLMSENIERESSIRL